MRASWADFHKCLARNNKRRIRFWCVKKNAKAPLERLFHNHCRAKLRGAQADQIQAAGSHQHVSVGDVVVDDEGHVSVVAGVGFKELTECS
jgi:hypothetical protein